LRYPLSTGRQSSRFAAPFTSNRLMTCTISRVRSAGIDRLFAYGQRPMCVTPF
jgi:hypothetical protein